MAKVTITLEDLEEGRVEVTSEWDPPILPNTIEIDTPAQQMGTMLLQACNDVFEKWTG